MKLRSFAGFVAPSVALMALLLALPLVVTLWLSTHNCSVEQELVTLQQTGPFGAHAVTTLRARLGAGGEPVETCKDVGLAYYRSILGLGSGQQQHNEFLQALRFTLVYVAGTTPFVLGGGLLLALAMNRVTQRLKGLFIAASLLPFIITPVVGALAIKWLFRDDGLVSALLAQGGLQLHWMGQAWSAQLLVLLYGVWHVLPFAFIVLYAGLQGVPQDALEAATLDGASAWQQLRYVTLPHLMPLVVFVLLIHVMDAYRVFEPVVVLTQGVFTTSVQELTYHVLLQEDNPYKASAAAVLTIVGIGVLLVPLLRKTWREQRHGG